MSDLSNSKSILIAKMRRSIDRERQVPLFRGWGGRGWGVSLVVSGELELSYILR